MTYDGWNYLEVIGRLGAALVDLLGGVMDFNTVDGFGMVLETGFTLVLVNAKDPAIFFSF